jgi:uncharacterized protein YrzB (UPF0473 family)
MIQLQCPAPCQADIMFIPQQEQEQCVRIKCWKCHKILNGIAQDNTITGNHENNEDSQAKTITYILTQEEPKEKKIENVPQKQKETFYEVLMIEKDASQEQIKKAYRIQAVRWHPDKNGGDEQAHEKVSEFLSLLKDMHLMSY